MEKTVAEFILNSQFDQYLSETNQKFDLAVMNLRFPGYFSEDDLSRVTTDGYGDAGSDYIFYTCDNKIFYSLNDIKDKKDSIIDIYVIQSKNTKAMSSIVPQKFIALMTTIFQFTTQEKKRLPSSLNESVRENIHFIRELLTKFALKNKLRVNFIYYGRFAKAKLQTSNDLIGNFETLKNMEGMTSIFNEVNYEIISIDDLIELIQRGTKFEYTFDTVNRFKVDEYNNNSGVIALISLRDYFNFIVDKDNVINEKLFVSNIRDFKGQTSINKDITTSLLENTEVDFWWLNNGITITVESLKYNETLGKIAIENPQIVNGLQTSYTISHFFKENPDRLSDEHRKLFVKFLEFTDSIEDQELNVIVATNRQNEIRDKDIRSNDNVQLMIERFFKEKGKFYQRKDKYYTNRGVSRNDVVKLDEMAKYVNTIFLRDPSGTRNNPGKLTKDAKYKIIFKIDDEQQDYNRYWIAYKLYSRVQTYNKGKFIFNNEEYDKINFIHHIVFITIIMSLNYKIDYTTTDLLTIDESKIDAEQIDSSYGVLKNILLDNGITSSKVLKNIKEASFNKKIFSFFENPSVIISCIK